MDVLVLELLKRINQFAIKSQEYITNIQGISKDTNMSRMRVGYRSQGLLEKHTISAAWVCFACFASLYLGIGCEEKLLVPNLFCPSL